jgi:hypothetical protein
MGSTSLGSFWVDFSGHPNRKMHLHVLLTFVVGVHGVQSVHPVRLSSDGEDPPCAPRRQSRSVKSWSSSAARAWGS